MMEEHAKRLHPFKIPFEFWKLLKGNAFFIIMLYVLNFGSEKTYMKVLQIGFLVYLIWKVISIILKWYTYKYQIKEGTIYITSGLISKSYRTVPLHKVQNVQQRTTLFHKIFRLTSLTFETGMTGDQGTVPFEVISRREAERLEGEYASKPEIPVIEVDIPEERIAEPTHGKTIHFTPTKQDVLKASFTSLSFLALIPILATLYNTLDDFINLENAEGFLAKLLDTWWIITIVLAGLICVAVAFGIVSTFVKYGKYEISSDHERIYIKKGVLDESAFSIQKEKVQAVEITQSIIKRLLGLAEVKLVSAGNTGDEELETNTLYPFLSIERAYGMVEEILPAYKVERSMKPLSKQAFKIRMLRPSFFWILTTLAIYYFKPSLWYISLILLVLIYSLRIMDYKNSRYLLNDEFIQFKSGSLETSLFITKRSKVIQIEVERSKLQKLFGLATIETINRSKPVHHTKLQDVSVEYADEFYTWYMGRTKNIQVE
ncbi:PH domain-containing protein [Bacillus sp. ISL-4]|uniref:PH domain-containing protein n=1 Tax=Bacillus sp. ISL-4 TaxID=2819125 RepID=UPI001BED1FC5|nr:PH domain-containing protein [Bacillus sp. ISL-4]MBT2664728.1 PH domain-containing protein [Bacillus sp. ISL-4]MBT2671518.1 PH domain-containing protein [Streptomyces sp. ISL-14]